jgi:peptidoglycan/LPS O-acetylase OafA/YrhL
LPNRFVAATWDGRNLTTQTAQVASTSNARVFHTLDALRGMAAIGVVIFHMGLAFQPLAVPGGYLAVDLFFIMSGVVLSHAYEGRFQAGMGTLAFMRARLIRLYPLYFLGLLLGLAVTVASLLGRNSQGWEAGTIVQSLALAIFFLPNFSGQPNDQIFPLNIPCWSLFMEIVVNLVFVLSWRYLTSRRLIVFCVVAGCALALSILQQGHVDLGSSTSSFFLGLLRTFFGFTIGVLLARQVSRSRSGISNLGVFAILACVGVAILGRPGAEWRAAWDAVCVLLVFPLVVYLGARVDPGAGVRKVATFLGLTSYAVYVLHGPVSAIFNSLARKLPGESGLAPWSGLLVLAALLLGCWLIDLLFDVPVRRWLSRVVPGMRRT